MVSKLLGVDIFIKYDYLRNGYSGFYKALGNPSEKRICGPYATTEECMKAIKRAMDMPVGAEFEGHR